MKRVWKPLDVANLRLYEVMIEVYSDGKLCGMNARDKFTFVLATSPRHAARLVSNIYNRSGKEVGLHYECFGKAVNVLMPEVWWQDGIPFIHDMEASR